MHCLQLCVILGASFKIHLLEHVQGRLLPFLHAWASLALQATSKLPAILVALQTVGFAIVPRSNDLRLGRPDERHERQNLGTDTEDGTGGLLRAGRVDNGKRRVVCGEGERITRR